MTTKWRCLAGLLVAVTLGAACAAVTAPTWLVLVCAVALVGVVMPWAMGWKP